MSTPPAAAESSIYLKFKEADQNEKSYQKQDAIFVGSKRVLGAKKSKKVINLVFYIKKIIYNMNNNHNNLLLEYEILQKYRSWFQNTKRSNRR